MADFDEQLMKMLRAEFVRPENPVPLAPALAKISEIHRECLAVFGFFHWVGVDSANISLGVNVRAPEGEKLYGKGMDLIAVAKMQPRPMVIRVAPVPENVDLEAFGRDWKEAVVAWNAAEVADKVVLIRQAEVYEDFPDFFLSVMREGVVFPAMIDYLAMLYSMQHQGPRN